MSSLERRLKALEVHQTQETRNLSPEALSRLTDEELDAYEAAVVRSEAGEEPTEEDRLIAARVLTIREEVGA